MEGILLFYKYVDVASPQDAKDWMVEECSALQLRGRVRVSEEGINVTVGGTMHALQRYMEALEEHPLFNGCDFKLGKCSEQPLDPVLLAQCGFDDLSVRIVKEIVTLGPLGNSDALRNQPTGAYVSPCQFHSLLQGVLPLTRIKEEEDRESPRGAAGNNSNNNGSSSISTVCCSENLVHDTSPAAAAAAAAACQGVEEAEVVVIDVRNAYETSVGRFCPPAGAGVRFLDPQIRQFSDLPPWLDAVAPALHGKRVLMYCTGGVRCERATAYLRSKGEGFQDVCQLSGGILRYLKAFPDGGHFMGKNFVFDPRIVVGSERAAVVGQCLVCRQPFDDYSSQQRCSICRMRILVCHQCCNNNSTQTNKELQADAESGKGTSGAGEGGGGLVCELCQGRGQRSSSSSAPFLSLTEEEDNTKEKEKEKSTTGEGAGESGADAAAAGAVEVAEEEEQQLCMRPRAQEEEDSRGGRELSPCPCAEQPPLLAVRTSSILTTRRKLRVLCLHGFRQSARGFAGRTAALQKRLRDVAEFVFIDGPHVIPSRCTTSSSSAICTNVAPPPRGSLSNSSSSNDNYEKGCWGPQQQQQQQLPPLKPRYAWLVEAQEEEGDGRNTTTHCHCPPTNSALDDPDQFRRQLSGWDAALARLERAWEELGPFDCLLGFSQGAAVAAAVAQMLQEDKEEEEEGEEWGREKRRGWRERRMGSLRCVILASGFLASLLERRRGRTRACEECPIQLPSLHVFGEHPGRDEQIGHNESQNLAQRFSLSTRTVVQHAFGHIIPSTREYVELYKSFLRPLL